MGIFGKDFITEKRYLWSFGLSGGMYVLCFWEVHLVFFYWDLLKVYGIIMPLFSRLGKSY